MWIHQWLFWTSVFFFGSCPPSEKYLGPKQSPPIPHNDFKKDGVQLLLSRPKYNRIQYLPTPGSNQFWRFACPRIHTHESYCISCVSRLKKKKKKKKKKKIDLPTLPIFGPKKPKQTFYFLGLMLIFLHLGKSNTLPDWPNFDFPRTLCNLEYVTYWHVFDPFYTFGAEIESGIMAYLYLPRL